MTCPALKTAGKLARAGGNEDVDRQALARLSREGAETISALVVLARAYRDLYRYFARPELAIRAAAFNDRDVYQHLIEEPVEAP